MEKEKNEHVQGRPWKVEGRFSTYEEAKQFLSELKQSENAPEEIKIKHMSSSKSFVVKSRRPEEKKTKNKK